MLPIYLDLTNARALGDSICATPTIKKLFESYERKINVISQYPEIFKNNPYVDRNYLSNAINIDYIKERTIKMLHKEKEYFSINEISNDDESSVIALDFDNFEGTPPDDLHPSLKIHESIYKSIINKLNND